MPRRRASKRTSDGTQRITGKGKKSGKRQWERREDIPLDEADECTFAFVYSSQFDDLIFEAFPQCPAFAVVFVSTLFDREVHEQRDKILLEGEAPAGDSDGDDDEVFALKGLQESSEEEDEGEDEYSGGEDDDNGPRDNETLRSTSKAKSKSAKASSRKPPASESSSSSHSEEEESWGQKKSAYYSSNAAQLDSDDDEAHEMEEQEARRLQAKLREGMRDDDYGFMDALQKVVIVDDTEDFWNPVENPTAPVPVADKATVIRHLQKTSPETLALAQEWDDIARTIMKAEAKLEQAQLSAPQTLGLIHLYHQTLLTYAFVLAFYLHLRSSPKHASRPDKLRSHPVFKRLLVLKQTLSNLEDLDIGLSDSEDEDEDDDYGEEEEEDELMFNTDLEDFTMNKIGTWLATREQGLEVGELDDLLSGASTSISPSKESEKPRKKKKEKEPKSKKSSEIIYDVEEPTIQRSSRSTSERRNGSASDAFGEATTLDLADAADKTARKRALRFHTSKIERASARREGARTAIGGDEDIPYKERRKEAEKRKKLSNPGAGGDDLDDADPEPVGTNRKRARDEDEDGGDDSDGDEDDEGYYSLIKRQKAEKKKQKKAEHDALRDATTVKFGDDATDGQRGITRAIMANKGLTPKRSKAGRNPRVKKRERYAKAQKVLSSQKAVYKGGIGDVNRYSGEQSGISKVVKSVRF